MSIKLCKDCAFHEFLSLSPFGSACAVGYWICNRPGAPVAKSYVEPVKGETITPYVRRLYCDSEREAGYIGARLSRTCGREARFFVPRPQIVNDPVT